jgi:hypothetical protein
MPASHHAGPVCHLYPGEMDRSADRLNEAAGMFDGAAWCVCGRLPGTAVARKGCGTSLLYGPISASKNTAKGRLTLILRL